MRVHEIRSTTVTAGLGALCGFWVWALFASPDFLLVLDRRIRLPILGLDVPCAIIFIAAPIGMIALFLAIWIRRRSGWPAGAALSAALFLNAVRCLKLHDPILSYVTAALAITGTIAALSRRSASPPSKKVGRFAATRLLGAGLIVILGGALLFCLIPWSLRGDLPGNMNNYPFGPAVRSLVFADLAGCVRSADASVKSLRGIRLEGADMRGAVLKDADLRNARLFRAHLERADLEGADLRAAGLVEARLSFANLRNADLSGSDLSGIFSMGADLRGATLRGAGAHVQRFWYVDARDANFESAELLLAEFFWADLRDAVFRNARLPEANLTRARLEGADFAGASLVKANMLQADLRDAILEGADLSEALGLEPDGLATAATLRAAKLDVPLLAVMEKRFPGLFR